MADPRVLAHVPELTTAIERQDAPSLLHVVAQFADHPDIDRAIERAAAAVKRLVLPPSHAAWPPTPELACLAIASAEVRRPRNDVCLTPYAELPCTWNWLVSVREVLAGRGGAELVDVHARLELGDVDGAAATLFQMGERAPARAWQALHLVAAIVGRGDADLLARLDAHAMQSIEAVNGGADAHDVPTALVAVLLARHAARGEPPSAMLAAASAGLPVGHARDLATAAALTGWSDAGPLSGQMTARLELDMAQGRVALASDARAQSWLDLLRRLLASAPVGAAHVFASEGAPEPLPNEIASAARTLMSLAQQALPQMPVTTRMAGIVLARLRRHDLVVGYDLRDTTWRMLGTLLMPANVLAAIEAPLDAVAHAERRLERADAATRGEVVTPVAVGRRIAPERISVCVVNFNQTLTTLRLLHSLQRIWPAFNGEVLLFDNGSTPAEFQTLSLRAPALWPGRVRILRADENLGPGPARNRLFAEARTEWILSLDNDMIVTRDLGQDLLPFVEARDADVFNLAYEELEHPGIAGVGKVWAIEDDGAGGKVFTTGFAAWSRADIAGPVTVIAANRLSGGASLFKTQVFRDTGGFGAETAIGYEDYDLSLRLAAAGYAIETCSRPLMVHGHLAPARATDLAAIIGRLDAYRFEASTTAFARTIAERYGAHLGERSGPRRAYRIVPARLDMRHVASRNFFAPTKPEGKTIAFVRDAVTDPIIAAALGWLEQSGHNVELRDATEFATPEQALLVLQHCDVIVAGAAVLRVDAQRAARVGLLWRDQAAAPHVLVLDPTHAQPGYYSLYTSEAGSERGVGPAATIATEPALIADALVAAVQSN